MKKDDNRVVICGSRDYVSLVMAVLLTEHVTDLISVEDDVDGSWIATIEVNKHE